MLSQLSLLAVSTASIASILVAGVFLAFSDFVMRALVRATPAAGIETMQNINREVYRSIFVPLLIALVPVTAIITIWAYAEVTGPAQRWLIIGSLVYLIGAFGVTILGNVPMNKKLDGMVVGPVSTRKYWSMYGQTWTYLNHVRAIASGITGISYMVAALLIAGQ